MPVTISRWIKRFGATCVMAIALSGCGLFDKSLYEEAFWSSSPFIANTEAELGIAELAKGNYVTAEGHFQRALEKDKRDVYALMGAGILYQNTGQFVKAREMYEAVLAIRPEESEQFVVWNQISTRPASQVASVNLSLLETGGTAGNTPTALQAGPGTAPIGGAPTGDVMLGRAPQVASAPPALPSASPQVMSPTNPAGIGQFGGGDLNVVSRFETLKALRDQGLVTEDEFSQRRRSNVGALLPLTSPPPSAGLDRPVPTTEQISARLRAIGRALEMRAISVSQHSAERGMILDALMPTAPVMVADPALPPQGLMQAADQVRRLEQLRDEGYISSDEYARERQAIELAMRPAQSAKPKAAAQAQPTEMMKKDTMAKASGPQPAVHLASYRSAKQAESGWTQIRRAHRALLGDLQHEVSRVKLGSKGTYFRLKAGPLKNSAEARTLCRALKSRRQFCDTSVMNGG